MNLLFVQDNIIQLINLIDECKKQHQHHLQFCLNGQEALDRIRSNLNYDIVFMNINMPKLNGIDATKMMREWGYDGKIVGMSFHSKNLIINRCIDAGMDDYLELGSTPLVSEPILNYIKLNSK